MTNTCAIEGANPQSLLFEQLELRAHQKREPLLYAKGAVDKPLYAVLATSKRPGQWTQWSVPIDRLQSALDDLPGEVNTYASQAVFYAEGTRQACYVEQVQVVFVDIDYRKAADLADLSPEEAARAVLVRVRAFGLPEPTIILDSGLGLHFKWPLRNPVLCSQFGAWALVQDLLCKAFRDLGADEGAKDLARVLRIPGTKNLKNGRVARLLRASDEVHDFHALASAAFKISPPTLLKYEQPGEQHELVVQDTELENELENEPDILQLLPPGAKGQFNRYTLHRARLHDFVTLCQKRGWAEAVPETNRNNILFAIAVSLSWLEPANTVAVEVHRIARKLTPDFKPAEINSTVTTVIKRAKAAQDGQKIKWNGKLQDPRYLLTNDWLIGLLKITRTEQRGMLTIIGAKERNARAAARKSAVRRASGAALRSDYLADANAKRQAALSARTEGKSWAEAAAVAGYKNAKSARMSTKGFTE